MKEIFEQYGGMIITAIAIFTVILVIKAVIGTDANGYMGQAFKDMIQTFMKNIDGDFSFKTSMAEPTVISIAINHVSGVFMG